MRQRRRRAHRHVWVEEMREITPASTTIHDFCEDCLARRERVLVTRYSPAGGPVGGTSTSFFQGFRVFVYLNLKPQSETHGKTSDAASPFPKSSKQSV